ncbi:hypothetical protein ACLOJK_005249 [Asimina triloba]
MQATATRPSSQASSDGFQADAMARQRRIDSGAAADSGSFPLRKAAWPDPGSGELPTGAGSNDNGGAERRWCGADLGGGMGQPWLHRKPIPVEASG